jgi:predicted ATP-dependent serine protease
MSTQGQDHRHDRVPIRRLPTGVPGLDEILGGGLPEYSFNIIAGAPGSGKTTLAHQLMFANATPEHPALYFTVLGEPAIKMLRYQQQFTFQTGRRDPFHQPQPAGSGERSRRCSGCHHQGGRGFQL